MAIDVIHLGDTTRIEATATKRGSGAVMDVSTATNTITLRPPGGRTDGSDDVALTCDFNNDEDSESTNDGTDGVFGVTLTNTTIAVAGDWEWQAFTSGDDGEWHSEQHTLRALKNLGG